MPAVAAAGQAGATEVGFVLDLRGEWALGGAATVPLRVGQALPAGGVIAARSPQASSFITVVLLDGTTTLTRSCRNAQECAKPLSLPDRVSSAGRDSFWARALQAMGVLLSREPTTVVPVMSRDLFAVEEELQAQEAIVALADGVIDLTSVMRGTSPGRYAVTTERLVPKRAASPPVVVSWDAASGARLPATDLQPGLYSVTVSPERQETYAPIGASAWVLVSDRASFERLSRSFDEAAGLTRTWGPAVKKQAVRRFLRAYLELLSEQSSAVSPRQPD